MRVHANKRAIRALGVAESFRKTDSRSLIAGVVMRADLVVDGFTFGWTMVQGDDATSSILGMYRRLKRNDVNVIILSGAIISLYNIIDVDELASSARVPVICLTYRESAGIEGSIRDHFGDTADEKILRYRRLGERVPLTLKTGFTLFARLAAISPEDANRVLDSFTLQGVIPEPVRVAKLLSRAAQFIRR